MTVLIDTCVILDALQGREPFDKEAMEIFDLVARRKVDGIITAKAITDIYYVYMRSVHDAEKARDTIKKLFSLFVVVDTLADDCYNACFSPMTDYEDGVMEQTARRLHAACIVTRNIKDYCLASIDVYSPTEFLETVCRED